MSFQYNKDLPIIKKEWKGNPFHDGQFVNPGKPMDLSFTKMLRWTFTPNPQKREKKRESWKVPVKKETFNLEGTYISWLGHASYFMKIGNTNLITDPVTGDLPFLKRHAKFPYSLAELPSLDYLLLSHNHRDHCDEPSIRRIWEKYQPTILTPLGMDGLIKGWLPQAEVQCAGWYQQYAVDKDGLEIFLLPARHWSRRGLLDTNQSLWGSFLIRHRDLTVYFSGDSSYAAHFQEIKKLFPKIDIALLPIGTYRPAFIMKDVHMNPKEAFSAFLDLEAEFISPMHYGIFDLSDEPMSEPIAWFRKIAGDHRVNGQLKELAVGEVWKL